MKLFSLSCRVSVSRAIKPFSEPGRPPDWFSQKVKKIYKSTCFVSRSPSLFLSVLFTMECQSQRENFFFCFCLALCLPILRAAGSHRSSQVSITKAPHRFDRIFLLIFICENVAFLLDVNVVKRVRWLKPLKTS